MKTIFIFNKINKTEENLLVKFLSKFLLFFLLFSSSISLAATITSTSTGGNWNTGSSWVGGLAPTTTDNIIIVNGATITLTAATSIANVTINTGGSLRIGTINALTVTGDFLNNGTFIGTTGRLYMTGTTKNFTNLGSFTMGSGRVYFYGNLINAGTHTLTATQVRFYGTATQTIASFTTTGLISSRKTGGTATFTGNVNGAGLTINGTGGTLNLGVGLTHNFTGNIALTRGTLNGGSSTLNVKSISTIAWNGTGTVFSAGTSTVNFSGTGNQTLSATTTTFNNLTFSTSGIKTLTTTRCIANGIVSIQGTATVSATPTYGTNATLQYNTATARNAGVEWITPFSALGGVNITNTGAITMNAAKVFNNNSPLTINTGATLLTNNFQLTFGGNFVNNGGTFTAGSSPIVITNTMPTQSISGFTTSGLVSSTKNSGIATLTGNVTGGGLTINGAGGTLNLGTALTHTFNNTITLTSGTLNGGSSLLNVNAISTTAWNGNGAVFSAGTGTVNFGAAGNQALSASATTFNNITFSNSGLKTLTTANCTVNGIVSMQGTATVSATPTYGANATLQYNTATARNAGVEWITPFSALGGVIIANTGAITMNVAKVFNASSPLTINTGATLLTNNLQLTFGGNFINNAGTFTAGSSPIVISSTMTAQSIAGFTTTGTVSMTKTAGTATFTGNVNGSNLTINGTGGTLNLGTSLTHTFTSNITRTAGTFNGGSSILRFAGTLSGTGGTFIANTGTIDYNGTTQTVVALPYYNLTLSGSGTKTFVANTTISNSLSVYSGVLANLGVGFIHSCLGLSLGGTFQVVGSYGGTTSGATYINTTYFTTATGRILNNCSSTVITAQPTNPTATCSGTGNQVITVTATGSGLTYTWRKSGIAVVNNAIISGQGTATLTFTNPTVLDAGSYDVVVGGTCSSSVTSNSVTVSINPSPVITLQPVSTIVCENTTSSFSVSTSTVGTTYQWQYSTNPVSTWTNTTSLSGISGHTTSTLNSTTTSIIYNNYNFRCVLTSTNGCITNSNTALLNVDTAPVVGTISSNQSICSGSTLANDIALTSATGTIQWQRADDAAFTTNLLNIGTNATTLTISEVGNLNVTTYFRAMVSNGICSPVISNTVIATIATTTWTSAAGGSWDNGTPTSTTAAIISYNYTTAGAGSGSFSACTLTVNNNANVIITSEDNVIVNGAITVVSGSSFTLQNNTNLIQNEDVVNSGNIIVKRKTNLLLRQDYVMWSSPIDVQNLLSFSPSTVATRFYEYNTTTNLFNSVTPSTTNFEIGKGYLIRLPNNHPTTPTLWTGTFTGVPNNGTINYGLTNISSGFRFNAIGNPYPSTIDMEQFVADNSTDITGTLYFWRKTNSTTSSPGYCTWNGGTFVSNGEAQVYDPNGVIQVGQGFIVEATATGSNVVFNNSQRINDNTNQTFKNAPDGIDDGRFWLNLTSSNNEFAQMAITYQEDATQEIDLFDAKYFNDAPIALNSVIESTDFAIQARALPFDTSDVVPLSYKVTNAGNYTITIDHNDGFFTTNNQEIYIHDLLLETTTLLNETNYTFASEAGVFTNRFQIVYQSVLANNEISINSNNVVVYKNNKDIVINTGNVAMKNVKLFDTSGRLLLEKSNLNATEIKVNSDSTNQVLLVQVTSTDNTVVTKKIVN